MPQDFLRRAELTAPVAARKAPLPPVLQQWLEENWGLQTDNLVAEWSPDELYLSLPRPGGDAWLRISLPGGEAEYELTDRGWIAYLNDLHKGRHAGAAWSWFIDIFGAATLVFSITGLFILKLHAPTGPSPGPWWVPGCWCRCCWRCCSSTESPSLKRNCPHATALLPGPVGPAGFAGLRRRPEHQPEVPPKAVSEYHRPYVAIWLERADQSVPGTLAVWYEVKHKDNEG